MKKLLIFLFSMFIFMSFSCDALNPEEEEEEVELTADDIENAAMATILGGMTSVELYGMYDEQGETATETALTGLAITEGTGTQTFAFTEVSVDFEEDGTADLILDGSFTFTEASSTFTYTNYKITNPETTTENMVVNGTVSSTGTDPVIFTSSFTVSGSVFSSSISVETVMSMPAGEGDPTFTSATVNGTDYATEFNAAMTSMFSEQQ